MCLPIPSPRQLEESGDPPKLLDVERRGQGAATRGRKDFTNVEMSRGADKGAALRAAATAGSRAQLLAEYEKDKRAPSTRRAADSTLATWIEFHDLWRPDRPGEDQRAFPLSRVAMARVAAVFKRGRYRSWKSYLS